MKDSTKTISNPVAWNVLTTPWIETLDLQAVPSTLSVIEVLRLSPTIHRIVTPSPLDLFAIHRFLITLLYWQAQDPAGVDKLRKSLLAGRMPGAVIQGLAKESGCFGLFDPCRPFLQDVTAKESKASSAAYLFSEMAAGTNVAHFHHGDDDAARLCLGCATLGLLRLVPWTQSGGAGKQPALHGAPPIMPLAIGTNLCETLGLNLVPTDRAFGSPRWSGQFKPSSKKSRIPLLEGLTWNTRRVYLGALAPAGQCMRCGHGDVALVGPIVFEKNPACKQDEADPAAWQDPAAFYNEDYRTIKTGKESAAATRDDLRKLFEQRFGKKIEPAPTSAVVAANPGHGDWLVVLPCTNPANNKSYDHRSEEMTGFDTPPVGRATFWHDTTPWLADDQRVLPKAESQRASRGVMKFVHLASRLDSTAWAVLSAAANQPLNHSPAAFDIFTGLYWPLRNKDRTLPSRNAAWLALKVMATAGKLRPTHNYGGPYEPWREISLRDSPAKTRVYPRSVPVGRALEVELRALIRRHAQESSPTMVDWPGLCQFIHNFTP